MHASTLLAAAGLVAHASSSTVHPLAKRDFRPQNKGVRFVGNVTNPSYSRDSCGSVKLGDRAFWTCRDTTRDVPEGQFGGLWLNSVGWTDYDNGAPAVTHGGPKGVGSTGSNDIVLMKGPDPDIPLFYPSKVTSDCSGTGICNDGTRNVVWPDSPPMVASTASDGTITAYTWIQRQRLYNLYGLICQPATILYKLTYKPNQDYNVLPTVQALDQSFWGEHEISYGSLGNVVRDGYAYLYGANEIRGVALARVPVNSVEDKSKYEYYMNGSWTRTRPTIRDDSSGIQHAGTGAQGTYYYSEYSKSYVWIGQAAISVSADFYITTAPSPEGPWIEPYLLYRGQNGDSPLGGYSLQAHPHMLRYYDDGIYLTWTQQFLHKPYNTPLIYVAFH